MVNEVLVCEELFRLADPDRSGTLDKAEFRELWRVVCGAPPTEAELDVAFASLDDDNDGKITLVRG